MRTKFVAWKWEDELHGKKLVIGLWVDRRGALKMKGKRKMEREFVEDFLRTESLTVVYKGIDVVLEYLRKEGFTIEPVRSFRRVLQ